MLGGKWRSEVWWILLHGTHLEVSIREGTKLGEGSRCAASSTCMEDIRLLHIINKVEKTEQAEEFWPSRERGFEVGRGCYGRSCIWVRL